MVQASIPGLGENDQINVYKDELQKEGKCIKHIFNTLHTIFCAKFTNFITVFNTLA